MKVVILCGGLGTRLREETEFRPKAMVEIGGRPILWHIMKIYAHYGFTDFVICLGYKGEMIRRYFLDYEIMNNDFTVRLGTRDHPIIHGSHREEDWTITLVDTGAAAMTGARVKRVEKYITETRFMLTYGDGVADIDIGALVSYHEAQGKIGTVTGARLMSRFGELVTQGTLVADFSEKPVSAESYINGGFFIFQREFFDYLSADDGCVLEQEPLRNLAKDGQLAMHPHRGFWHCMDTYRDLQVLSRLWDSPRPPWKVWDDD
jgi:glucose-1-phosphate cytidylyltransferase